MAPKFISYKLLVDVREALWNDEAEPLIMCMQANVDSKNGAGGILARAKMGSALGGKTRKV